VYQRLKYSYSLGGELLGWELSRREGDGWRPVFFTCKMAKGWVEEVWGADGTYTKNVWTKRAHGAEGSEDHVSRTVVHNGVMTVTGFNLKNFVFLETGETYPATVTWTYLLNENNAVNYLIRYDARVIAGDSDIVSANWDFETGGEWEHTGNPSHRIQEGFQRPPNSIDDGSDWSGWR
jgi:hypothetical protein